MKEMHEEGELLESIESANSLNTKLKWLTHKSPVTGKYEFHIFTFIFLGHAFYEGKSERA